MTVKTANDIRDMTKVCQLAAQTLQHVVKFVKAGVTTNELDQIAYDYTLTNDARPAPLNYNGFPKSICTSVNHCICHGVPDDRPLKDGDIINIEVDAYLLSVDLSDEEIAKRKANFKPIKKLLTSSWLGQYRALVTNASNGAMLKTDL